MMHHTIDWLLWRSLHLLFTIFCLLCSAISRAGKFLSGAVFTSTESAAAANGLEDKAVAVAVVFEDLQGVDWIDQVSMLVSWLSAINVTHVTLFDPHDVLKESQKSLQKVLKFLAGEDQQVYCYTHKRSQLRCDLDGSRSPLESYQSKFISREDNCLLGELSGLRKRRVEHLNAGGGDNVSVNASDVARVRDLKVELLSLADGKEALVRAARNVCENAYKLHYANHHQSKLPKLTEQDVNDSLQVNGSEGPDPDLLLLFGKTRSLHGFPPWRLRLTEIVHMGSLEQMSASSLVGALKEFAKKTHRYGRGKISEGQLTRQTMYGPVRLLAGSACAAIERSNFETETPRLDSRIVILSITMTDGGLHQGLFTATCLRDHCTENIFDSNLLRYPVKSDVVLMFVEECPLCSEYNRQFWIVRRNIKTHFNVLSFA